MRRILFSLLVMSAGIFLCSSVFAAEKIDSYHVDITINEDSSINVSEWIGYDFGTASRHGIYRDIPVKYKARGGNFNLRLSSISAQDERGNSYNFEKSAQGKNIQIKIGDADQYVTGRKTYIINYKIKRAINFLADHDELYWNAIGTEWSVNIANPTVSVFLPGNIQAEDVRKECFTGRFGSTEKCADTEYDARTQKLTFQANKLDPTEGMTIVVGIPKGIIQKPIATVLALDVLFDNLILILPIGLFLFFYYLWHTKGRDPEGRKVIIAQFGPPDGLTPGEVGTIIDEKTHGKDISAEIVNLAVKGYLKIRKIEEKEIFNKDDYLFEKLKYEDDLENRFERKLMQGLFRGDLGHISTTGGKRKEIENLTETAKTIKLSEIQKDFYKEAEDVEMNIYKSVHDKGYFSSNPQKTRKLYIGLGIFIISSMLYLSDFVGLFFGVIGIVSVVLSGIIVIFFGLIMPAKTLKGVQAKEHALGLKRYLSVAEKDRIKFHNAPEKNPAHFEKLLPYAMVLGVEKEWAKQFEGIYTGQPDWYNDPTGARFNSLFLVNSLGNFSSIAHAALTSPPSTASSGGSGFSGGGVGGGFGGGGGGSW